MTDSPVMYSAGMDMGGTFTDGYFSDGRRAVVVKVPTTHFDPTRSVMACLGSGAARLGFTLEDFLATVDLFRLATTIGTNSVVTGSGDPVGVMVEPGAAGSLYGPNEPNPAIGTFVRADHIVDVEASERAETVLGLCRDLIAHGVRQVVVSLKRQHRTDEERLRRLVRDRYPAHYLRSIPLILGSEVADVDDDELRTTTAILNAYLSRPMAKLLYRTEGLLQHAGLAVPLLAVRSDGSCSRTARATAISTYSSGPAAGLALVAAEARVHGDAVAVGFDMGGTTLDLGLVRDGAYQVDPTPVIRGVRVWLPVPGLVSVGLGGSSIATVDDAGTVTVGPASAGAVPGPAAFNRGGTAPTLTDADVVLGFLNDGQALAGDIVLDAERAAAALAPLAGGDPVEGAGLVRSAAHDRAASALADLLADAGIDPAAVTLYAFGGAGGLHAGAVAERVGIGRVRSFVHGGVFSARGVAGGPLRQVYEAGVEPGQDPRVVTDRLMARARLDLETERLAPDDARIAVDLHGPGAGAVGPDRDPGVTRVVVTAVLDSPPVPSVELDRPVPPIRRNVGWAGAPLLTTAVDLAGLAEGETLDGPALIVGLGTVHALPPGWTGRRQGHDGLLWERSR